MHKTYLEQEGNAVKISKSEEEVSNIIEDYDYLTSEKALNQKSKGAKKKISFVCLFYFLELTTFSQAFRMTPL